MFEIKCPECKANTKGLLRDYLQWRSDKRKCPSCGAQLEISNAILCFGLCGLIFGVLIGSSHYWDFGNGWIRLVTAILICWIILPIIVRTIGRWNVLPCEQKNATGMRKLLRLVPISLLSLAIVFGITYCIVLIAFSVFNK
jgi:phage shock protein PspC (stress-responsive transcriptional regulator)